MNLWAQDLHYFTVLWSAAAESKAGGDLREQAGAVIDEMLARSNLKRLKASRIIPAQAVASRVLYKRWTKRSRERLMLGMFLDGK